MKRPLILAALATAAVAIPAALVSANLTGPVSAPTCTTTGVKFVLNGFDSRETNNVGWRVLNGTAPVASGKTAVTGEATVDVNLVGKVAPNTPVTIEATWGPLPERDTKTLPSLAVCTPVTTVPTTSTTTTPNPPPGQTTTTPTGTTPVTAPKPPKPRPVRDCAWLRGHGAGTKTLKKFGCVLPPKKCKAGERRIVTKRGGAITVNCIRTRVPEVTG